MSSSTVLMSQSYLNIYIIIYLNHILTYILKNSFCFSHISVIRTLFQSDLCRVTRRTKTARTRRSPAAARSAPRELKHESPCLRGLGTLICSIMFIISIYMFIIAISPIVFFLMLDIVGLLSCVCLEREADQTNKGGAIDI